MSLPLEVKLQTILQKKEEIREATDEISEIIKKLGKGSPYVAAKRGLQKSIIKKLTKISITNLMNKAQ